MRVTCVGGGPAGLFLAVLAQAGGHQVTVLERHEREAPMGWGVVFFDGLLEAIEEHDAPTGRAVRERAFQWSGQVLDIEGSEPVHLPRAGYSIRRPALLDLLSRRAEDIGVDIRYGVKVTDPSQVPEHDVLVAADGVRSGLRTSTPGFGTEVDERENVFAWLGTTQAFDAFTFPFVRTSHGWAWAHAYTMEPGTSGFVVEMSPAVMSGLGLDRLPTDEALRTLEGLFAAQLQGHPLMAAPGTGDRLPFQRFPRVTNRSWRSGRTVLLGDAAHSTHFSIGSGTRLAMGDAMALAAHLRGARTEAEIDAALDAYCAQRQAELAPIQGEALNSVKWFEDVDRYLRADPHRFAMLFDRRRTPTQRRLPVPLYLALAEAATSVRLLGRLGSAAAGVGGRRS